MNIIISINGHFTLVSSKLTILQACESVGCFVPRFCFQPSLSTAGNCRICLVRIYGSVKPIVSCTVFVSVGMAIYTARFFVSKARESVLEFLLLNHPLDCPVCDQGGMCDLQEQSFAFGLDRSRFFGLKRSVVDHFLGPIINTVINRCIQCTRCVRFCSEVSGRLWGDYPSLLISGRGARREITTYSLSPLLEPLSGNVIDLCPVGALTKKPYIFIGRPWESRIVASYDMSSGSINKVYFSTLVENGVFIRVSTMDGQWVSNQTRFSYDALGFAPLLSAGPITFKLRSLGSIFLGRDLSLFDLLAISFFCDGLIQQTPIFGSMAFVDKARPSFWGMNLSSSNIPFSSFDFILLVGASISQIAPSLFACVREAFCEGSFVASFGPIGFEPIVISAGNRFIDFISFVLGFHRLCLPFSIGSKSLILFSISLFSNAYHRSLWLTLIDKLRYFNYFVSFINVNANEVAYFCYGPLNSTKPLILTLADASRSITVFGYIGSYFYEVLWANFVKIEFYCGSWPIGTRFLQRTPLSFQRTSVCNPYGEVLPLSPLTFSGTFSTLFDYSVSDVVLLRCRMKYWSVPVFTVPKTFVFNLNWVEPIDFYSKVSSFNRLIQPPVGFGPFGGWAERSYICRQFQLFSACVDFNFLFFKLLIMGFFFISSWFFEGLVLILFLLLAVAFFTLAERKVLSAIQRRRGPNTVGFFGLRQALSDGLKLFLKESILPTSANSLLFFVAPILTFSLSLLLWVCLPIGPNLVFIDMPLGVLYIFAISSLGVYGVLVAGWSSNRVYAFFGALRSTAQMISYEVSIGFILVTVLICCGSMNLSFIVESQNGIWFCFPLLPAFVIFIISILAETNRHPFDLPEAESELVSGYNVEYSAIGFALFFLGEYGSIIAISVLASLLFLGGWLRPSTFGFFSIFPRVFWIALKTLSFICFFIIARAAFPRYRYDQLMRLGWKVFLPISLGFLIFNGRCLVIFDGLAL